jgi:hypothetical protein
MENPLGNRRKEPYYFLCEMHDKLYNVLEVPSIMGVAWRYIHTSKLHLALGITWLSFLQLD